MRKTKDRKIVVMPEEFLRLIGEDDTDVISVHVFQNHTYGVADQITITITEVQSSCQGVNDNDPTKPDVSLRRIMKERAGSIPPENRPTASKARKES